MNGTEREIQQIGKGAFNLEKDSCTQPPLVSTNPPQDSTQSDFNSTVTSLVSASQPSISESQSFSESQPSVSKSTSSFSESTPSVFDSTPSVFDSTPLAETNISLNGCKTKTISNGPHKVFYNSLVEALNANNNAKPATNEECSDTDLMSDEEMTTQSTNSKAALRSRKTSRTRTNKISSQVKIPKPILNSEKLISEIIASCDRHVFGQTSSIQVILNICSQIMPIVGCEKHGNDIMDVCSQILSDAYRNSQNIIELCKRLSKWQAKIEINHQTKSKVKIPKKKAVKKNKNKGKTKPTIKVKIEEEEEDEQLDESPVLSNSEDELNRVDDPDWTSYWAKKNSSGNSRINADVADDDRQLRKKRKMSEDDTDWVQDLDQKLESKSSKKDEKSVRKRPPPIRGEFKCYQCPRIFPTLKGFQNHLECHKKVTCELCNLVCTKPHLKRHMMVHTGEKPFICDVCGSGFADVSSMKDHQHVHTDVKKVQCELCDYRCKTVKRLRMHMIRHTTERRFQCDNCGARFLRNSDLKKHQIVHRDTYPFACGNCPKRFKDKMHLKRHEETHTDQYKFQCPFCGKRMRQSGNLKTHMRTHNGEKPYKCEKCGQGFAHNVTKKQHQENCHRVYGVEVLIP